ncbi:2-aminoethylphosphonate ABC transporter substrate-binding protein [Pseudonocardia spinosispora]|uniref:2-aminoethylphosphonate ABC transporter substrate-binding protein n=1 Tax=Pseudonocardia spinosispora TaxID=103441 RepID=UPI0003FB7DD0|nr:2-aminoethylphosphonate ABC transporter substrate-binding protein [Pseudonocardia spinosispora]
MRIRSALLAIPLTCVLALLAACGGTAPTGSGDNARTVTVYSADGLGPWYQKRFAEFTQQTGITVTYIEAGSGEVVSRVDKERPNPQADVLVTLPPFIQQAAGLGLLQPSGVDLTPVPAADRDPGGLWTSLVGNYPVMIAHPASSPAPTTWQALLDPAFSGKLQYSTPGEAGDGTALLLQLQHVYGEAGALDYLSRLQRSSVGPSSSTGKLQPKVAKGELLVANGDLQMNLQSILSDHADFQVFWPADDRGVRSTFSLPYAAGLAVGAPHADNGRKLLQFLLSAPVQQTVSAQAYGVPVRADVHPTDAVAARIAQLMQGVEIWQPDWNSVAKNLDTQLDAYRKATNT